MTVKSVKIIEDVEKNGVQSIDVPLSGPLDDYSLVTEEVPVLIAGGGPSGLLQAYMLSRLGGKQPILSPCRHGRHIISNTPLP